MLKVIDELDQLNEDDLNQQQTVTRVVGTAYGQDTQHKLLR